MTNLAEVSQASVNQTECLQIKKTSKHGKHKEGYFAFYYQKNKQKYLLSQQKHRTKIKTKKPLKLRSLFSLNREKNLLSCLNKHHITVPVPRFLKVKHPIIQGWNKPNYWYKETIFELLKKGWNYFTLLNKDKSYQGVRIGCIDIDEKGWTKLPTKYWCCYISAGNGKIKLLFLYRDNRGLKTSAGYFQDQKILDFKISGGIMGLGSIHPNGKPYSLKGAGSFFLQNNKVFNSPHEVIELLKQDWGIEVLSIKEHFIKKKELEGTLTLTKLETLFTPKVEPPMNYKGLERNNFSKIGNY